MLHLTLPHRHTRYSFQKTNISYNMYNIYFQTRSLYFTQILLCQEEIDLKHMNLSSFVLTNVLNYSIEIIITTTKTPILKIGNFIAKDSFDISSLLFFFQ